MAQIPLQSIKFPGLPDTYQIPQIDKSVRFDIEQNKTEAEKKRARTNLGILYSESFNDAIRHFLEIVLRKSIYTEDITTIIDYLIGAINGIDGVSKNGDTLIIRYSINDPSQQNDVLSFEK